MCILPGLRPGPHWGNLQNSPDLLLVFRELLRGREEGEGEKEEKEEKGRG